MSCNEQGFIIADSRSKAKNALVAHSVFTQKFQVAGDEYHRVLEMPTFGHSENHVGIQLADLVCSALLFPMAAHAYCLGYVANLHVHADHGVLKHRFGARLRTLQYRFQDTANQWRGGITVRDELAQRPGSRLF